MLSDLFSAGGPLAGLFGQSGGLGGPAGLGGVYGQADLGGHAGTGGLYTQADTGQVQQPSEFGNFMSEHGDAIGQMVAQLQQQPQQQQPQQQQAMAPPAFIQNQAMPQPMDMGRFAGLNQGWMQRQQRPSLGPLGRGI